MDPSNPVGQRISGEFALEKKDTEKAITLYESAFKGDPKDAKTIIKLGDIYKSQQMWEKYRRKSQVCQCIVKHKRSKKITFPCKSKINPST